MKKELPITTEPWVRTYSYYALPLCIIMAEERIGEHIAEFDILDSDGDDWTSINMDRGTGNSWFYNSQDEYNRDCNGCIYRPLKHNEGYIRVKIKFQQPSEPWAAINLFVSDDENNILLGDEQYLCRFGNFVYDGLSLYFNGKKSNWERVFLNESDELILSVSNSKIEVFVDGKKLVKIGERTVDLNRQLFIGVQLRHENNSFYPWIFSNFIQINCDVDCMHRRLDYYSFYKDEEYELLNYFLDYNRFDANELVKFGVIRCLKRILSSERYVELKLDQYYLEGRDEYHSNHHLHQNLIYGFDDRHHTFMTIGYDNSGKINTYEIHYSELKNSVRRYPQVQIKIITYRQGIHFYHFLSTYVKGVIKDYLLGENSEFNTQSFLPTENRIYGIGIYEELKKEKGLDVLVSDRRVSYLLYEHKVIMEKRISYMFHIGILKEKLFFKAEEQIHNLVGQSFNLLNMAQKYRIQPAKRNDETLKKMLDEMKVNEKHLLEKILEEGIW